MTDYSKLYAEFELDQDKQRNLTSLSTVDYANQSLASSYSIETHILENGNELTINKETKNA